MRSRSFSYELAMFNVANADKEPRESGIVAERIEKRMWRRGLKKGCGGEDCKKEEAERIAKKEEAGARKVAERKTSLATESE